MSYPNPDAAPNTDPNQPGADYKDAVYLAPRIIDKLFYALIVLTLYLGEGDEMAPAKIVGLTGTLFQITAFCAFGAGIVVGTIIIDRPLFCAPLPALASSPDSFQP